MRMVSDISERLTPRWEGSWWEMKRVWKCAWVEMSDRVLRNLGTREGLIQQSGSSRTMSWRVWERAMAMKRRPALRMLWRAPPLDLMVSRDPFLKR